MSMDGLAIRALVAELAGLRGGRIVRVYQPDETDLVLHIRTADETVRLLLSAHPSLPRIHPLSRGQPVNPPEPPAFCMFMRKHCEGAVVESVRQVGTERIVHFDLRRRDELGDAGLAELTLGVGLFLGLAKVLITLGLEPEEMPVTILPTPGSAAYSP